MKRIALLALSVTLTLPLFAEEAQPANKTQLIASIVKMLDVEELARETFAIVNAGAASGDDLAPRIDYKRLGHEIYSGLLEARFTADELREMLAFCQTKAGQKFVATLLTRDEAMRILPGTDAFHAATEAAELEQRTQSPVKVTMADMRSIAVAAEARATDENNYPVTDIYGLELAVEPTYIRTLPVVDAWGTPFVWISDGSHYRVVSAGADKRFEMHSRDLSPGEIAPRPTEDEDADIIFQDGSFVQFPKGAQPQ
jgi:hypothetical protein